MRTAEARPASRPRHLRLPPSQADASLDPLRTFSRHEGGATAIEYGLVASLIAVALIAVLSSTSGSINTKFRSISSVINTAG